MIELYKKLFVPSSVAALAFYYYLYLNLNFNSCLSVASLARPWLAQVASALPFASCLLTIAYCLLPFCPCALPLALGRACVHKAKVRLWTQGKGGPTKPSKPTKSESKGCIWVGLSQGKCWEACVHKSRDATGHKVSRSKGCYSNSNIKNHKKKWTANVESTTGLVWATMAMRE